MGLDGGLHEGGDLAEVLVAEGGANFVEELLGSKGAQTYSPTSQSSKKALFPGEEGFFLRPNSPITPATPMLSSLITHRRVIAAATYFLSSSAC